MKALALLFAMSLVAPAAVHAQDTGSDADSQNTFMEEFDPFDPQAEEILKAYDSYYEQQTGESSHLEEGLLHLTSLGGGCSRSDCGLWADVVRSEQRLYLYEQGQLIATWPVSTGIAGRSTPNFDTHPDGRIYQRYMSNKYPGGDYNGLGNMPYAVFISGGFAIHGTARSNWSKLGHRASHGCIRVLPSNAERFNAMVRHYGVGNVWVTVEENRTSATSYFSQN